MRLAKGPKSDFERFLSDGDMARLMRVSVATVRRLATRGPVHEGGLDIRLAEPLLIGDMRRWPRAKVYALLGIGGEA